ncbi:hypothetical protein LCGC14_2932160 [marine sediment metagenome]|uniref:Uncharacterized protein n=1 Tax=marine sediment metagenome TaxID=412755 RepID=A0A0F8Y7K9_9ZZZZ
MKLSDLKPGDVFRYLDGRREFLNGLFMKMHQSNTYIQPMAKKRCNFIISLDDGMPHNHTDRREVEIVLKYKEDNMVSQKQMSHFIDWKFGVPVRILNIRGAQVHGFSYLVNETKRYFTTVDRDGNFDTCSKVNRSYELIPHKYGAFSPRYPVLQNSSETVFCNSAEEILSIGVTMLPMKPYLLPTATFNIDGKTIELSAETTAELKRKLGV